jgi:predicted ATP-binding protein involved in virulence
MQQASLHSQVIVTTHSPELLDAVKVGDVRVVERRDGATMIARMSEDQRELVKNGLMTLGEVMRSGGIQPQPEQLDLPHVEEPAPARE